MDKDTVRKVIDNNGTAEEVKDAIKWLRTDEGSEYLSELISDDFKALSSGKAGDWAECDIPEEEMKRRFLDEIRKHRNRRSRRFSIAACIAVPFLILAGGLLFVCDKTGLLSPTEYYEVNVPAGETARLILSDGTDVVLNSMTRMKYPSRFGLFRRDVELEGEAYFNVTKDESRPFTVNLDMFNIKVLGTRFNVKAYSQEPVRVSLEEGSVKLSDGRTLNLTLKSGENAEYDRWSGNCRITRPAEMEPFTSWKHKRQTFSMTSLNEVLKTLERQYDVYFTIRDSSMLNDRFTLSFPNRYGIETVLDDIQTVSRVKFRKTPTGDYEVFKE